MLLYQYAMDKISSEDKAAVEAYIKTDEEAANIAEALRELHAKQELARDDDGHRHYNICFGLENGGNVTYSNMLSHLDEEACLRCNKYLDANDGSIPPGEDWFVFGFGGNIFDVMYDNEGNILEYEVFDDDGKHKRVRAKKMKKVYFPAHWQYMVYYNAKEALVYNKLDIASNLYQAKYVNYFGTDIKSGLYLALPEKSVNIKMKHGIGVLDCGKYKIIYDDRYVEADEGIWAECTFNLG